ncbi:ABC transporter substrate-binding protein [Sagittula sp. NFXS13]|uniref:Branched-chain amino acid transport system substrate-binding protein n=1 Tax=Sagittula marina TaxID=943940 RepID=A0A7W6GUX9_9RHOB|nr:ABC transporter substrate-binding protein [Sagittula marina]MBB3988277.1 branched-chain amino acid transport system substrate-binding protein [Sagittula marina]
MTLKTVLAGTASLCLIAGAVQAQDQEPITLGIPVFLSGAASGPFGLPQRNAAEVIIAELNAGNLPAPYDTKGINGRMVEANYVDEAADAVQEYRNMAEREGVDAVVGYTSSGNCKAVAPLAEELQQLTVLVDCGTPQIFESVVTDPTYLFRTGPTGTIDSVGAARYLVDTGVDMSEVAGINQNYAWGQDAWADFTGSLIALDTGSDIATEQFPQVFAGQYGAEISALLTSGAKAIHTSFWGGDLEAFILQAAPRGLFARSAVVMTTGEAAMQRLPNEIPEGAIIGARGPYSYFAPESELATWFRDAYEKAHGQPPSYPAWKMAQALLGLKSAWEKAGSDDPAAIAKAFENLEYETPAGTVRMAIGNGHQAVQGIAYGTYKQDADGNPGVENVIAYAAECVNPPNDTTAAAWIEAGFPGASCN